MSTEETPLVTAIEFCLVRSDDEAWRDFFTVAERLIEGAFLKRGQRNDFHEFRQWFQGWLFSERKLHSAYRALTSKTDSGELATDESQEAYLSNYLANVVRSGVSEFYEERASGEHPEAEEARREASGEASQREDRRARVVESLAQLPPEIRVPFWLKYYHVCGLPTTDDISWIAEQTGMSPREITNLVQDEAADRLEQKYPLSSAFIGGLLGIPATVDGSYAAVDQRVRRALLRLRQSLSETGHREVPR